jgi:multidrug resistance efflux pump
MLELMFCSLFTIVPDYLYRRYRQGKRFGKEITLFSVWFELRWGITGCVILAILLITTVFYNHPSTTNVTLFFRTVPIVPETIGRVAEIHVGMSGEVKAGQPIFRLDSSKQEAAVETARRKITEVDAEMTVARADVQKADSQVEQAKSVYQQTTDELETKQELYRRNPGNVPLRDIEKLQVRQQGDLAAVAAAEAAKKSAQERVSTLLPAQKASAESALDQAQVELDKTVVRAGVSGRVEQFALRVGDLVNPLMGRSRRRS